MRALTFAALFFLAAVSFANSTGREKVREYCLDTYVYGMTQEIADELMEDVGPSSVQYLEELLEDCSFEKRDNVVAFLGFLSNGIKLLEVLEYGACADSAPGNYRVELLLPHVLGHAAAHGHVEAKAVFMEAMSQDSNGGIFYEAAQRAANPDTRLVKLAKQALVGLREGAWKDADMNATLHKLASREITPPWIPQSPASGFDMGRAAQDAQSLVSGFDMGNAAQDVIADMNEVQAETIKGSTIPSQPFTETAVRAQIKERIDNIFVRQDHLRRRQLVSDTSNDSHRLAIDFANHVDLDSGLAWTSQEIDLSLSTVSEFMTTEQFSTDVACCVTFGRDKPVNTFGTPGDSLDTIITSEDLRSAMRDEVARFKAVSVISYCSGPVTNAAGCARIGGFGSVIVKEVAKIAFMGKLIIHEYGHNAGLRHSSDNRFFMHGSISSKPERNVGITQEECDSFHVPPAETLMAPQVLGECPLPPPPTTNLACTNGFVVDFESGTVEGWTNSSASTCTDGKFMAAKPDFVEQEIFGSSGSRFITVQPQGDHTTGTGYALFTAPNTEGAGKHDVDGGVCVTESPEYGVDDDSTLEAFYFFGQRDGGDDPDDFFIFEISTNGGNTWRDMIAVGDKNSDAAWTRVAVDYIPAGSKVILRLSASDGVSATDLIEAGIDDLHICPFETPPTCIVADFEGGTIGWTNNAQLSNCTTGAWTVGSSQETFSREVKTQLEGDHTTGNGYAFFTANNPSGSAGNAGVDNGVCVGESPEYEVIEESDVSIWWFHGQRDTGDDDRDYFKLQMSSNGGNSWGTLVHWGDKRREAVWTQAKTRVPANSNVKFRIHASDGESSGDIIEAGIDDLTICAAYTTCSTIVDFESGMEGWTNNAQLSNCTTGAFLSTTPDAVISRGVLTQLEGDHTYGSTGKALFTARNDGGVGRDDVDKGVCCVESPVYNVDLDSTLSFWYFFGQRDPGDDENDFLLFELSTNGGNSWSNLVSFGDELVTAEWTHVSVDVEGGDDVQLKISVSDGPAEGDLVEAGIDDVRICPK